MIRTGTLVVALLSAACGDGSEGILARAGEHDFTVDEAVRLLGGQADLPNEPQVAGALAELWVDYTLLAMALAEDSTLSGFDMEPMVRGRVEQDMIMALRDSIIRADTVVAEDELRGLFRSQAPGAQVRARHILLGFPLQATTEQRDSVRLQAEGLLGRVRAGESFETLARQFSQDPGSASNGGDLGFFGRTDMVEPFANAAFALEPGEVSDVVETPMGYHVIRTDEKQVPTYEDVAPQFRQQIREQRLQQAESLYVTDMQTAAKIDIEPEVAEIVRRITQDPQLTLSRRAQDRVLVRYVGGSLNVGELRAFMLTQDPEARGRLSQAPDSILLDNVLKGLTQRKLLVAEARVQGFEPAAEYVDSLETSVRSQLIQVGRALSLLPIQPQGTESMSQAIDRTVEAVLRGIVSGGRDVIPLGAVATALREDGDAQVFESATGAVVQGVAAVRGPIPPPPSGVAPQNPPPGPTGG
jgi:parvulin-like peptidyl-prolyl isomerase